MSEKPDYILRDLFLNEPARLKRENPAAYTRLEKEHEAHKLTLEELRTMADEAGPDLFGPFSANDLHHDMRD